MCVVSNKNLNKLIIFIRGGFKKGDVVIIPSPMLRLNFFHTLKCTSGVEWV